MKLLIALLCVVSLASSATGYSLLETRWNEAVARPTVAVSFPDCNQMPFGPMPPCPIEQHRCPACVAACEATYTAACENIMYFIGGTFSLCLEQGGSEDFCAEKAQRQFDKAIAGPAGDYYECIANAPCVPIP